MALTRRALLCTLPLCVGILSGCSPTLRDSSSPDESPELLNVANAGPGAPTILVFMPDTTQTHQVLSGLRDELGKDFRLVALRVDASSHSSVIEAALKRYAPAGLVLMNNPTVNAYKAVQRSHPEMKFPPAVVVMTSFLETQAAELRGTTGISYEVPLITAITNLRRLLVLPSERVGVVGRAGLRGYINRQIELCALEKISVVTEEVSSRPNSSELKRALRRLKQQVDVIWIMNDNKLLTPRLISEGWLPGLDERPWLPSVVGAASLVSARSNLGTFAVLPDHVALGSQAASMLLDIADDDWQVPSDQRVELALSTTTTIDLVQTHERFTLKKDALQQVDRILQ
jgi:hypothetical protein